MKMSAACARLVREEWPLAGGRGLRPPDDSRNSSERRFGVQKRKRSEPPYVGCYKPQKTKRSEPRYFGGYNFWRIGSAMFVGLLFLRAILSQAAAEEQPYRIRVWRPDEGLPQSSVTSV